MLFVSSLRIRFPIRLEMTEIKEKTTCVCGVTQTFHLEVTKKNQTAYDLPSRSTYKTIELHGFTVNVTCDGVLFDRTNLTKYKMEI